jgi:hypothetical protein
MVPSYIVSRPLMVRNHSGCPQLKCGNTTAVMLILIWLFIVETLKEEHHYELFF